MSKIFKNETGAALVITLAVVAALLATVFHLTRLSTGSMIITSFKKDQFQAEQLALSGIDLCKMILTGDAQINKIDSVQEPWADSDMLSQAVNELNLGKETLTIKITDELSKIQVNALIQEFPGHKIDPDQEKIWYNLLNLVISSDKSIDERNPEEIINCMKDWMDSEDDDATTGLSGAESDYYLNLDIPYECANGPFNHVNELFNVKGITKDLLKSKISDAFIDLPEIDEGLSDAKLIEDRLSDVFTIYGLNKQKTNKGGFSYSGKININTAGVYVLAALIPKKKEDAWDLAQELVDFRELKTEQEDSFVNSLDNGWYEKVITDLSQKEKNQFKRTIKYSSDIFKVESTAKKNDASVTFIAFLKREKYKESQKWMCRTIQIEREYNNL